jgi:hypothetical protein
LRYVGEKLRGMMEEFILSSVDLVVYGFKVVTGAWSWTRVYLLSHPWSLMFVVYFLVLVLMLI